MPIKRRSSQDEKCDISEGNFKALQGKSRKVDQGNVYLHKKEEFEFDLKLLENNGYPDQRPYKDMEYRQRIAGKYGMYLTINAGGCWDPHLQEDGGYHPPKPEIPQGNSLFTIINKRFAEVKTAQTADRPEVHT